MKKISIKNLKFSLDGNQILDDVNVEFVENNLYLIVGRNGSGKSTFLKILNKQLTATSGEIVINGRDINEYSNKELVSKIAYLPQKITFNAPYLVRELLEMSMYSSEFVSEDIIKKSIKEFQLEKLINKPITRLSGGEIQRVLLASTYLVGGKFILLDEPFSFLDPGQRDLIFRQIKSLHEQNVRTFILVVNSLEEIFMFKDLDRVNILTLDNQRFNHYESMDKSFIKALSELFNISLTKEGAIDEK